MYRILYSGHDIGGSTIWRILKNHGIDPAPNRASVTWTQFLRSQAAIACDFATVDTALLRRYYLLFFVDGTIIWNQHQLERLVTDYIDHYNTHRPHRSLDQRPPLGNDPLVSASPDPAPLRIVRSTRCEGLINEYRHAA
ncbi:MAG: integrase core domain-containing protein [Acidimicrobiales bacterium]